MNYPSTFYCQDLSDEAQYSFESRGKPVFSRLIEGKAWWEKEGARILKKKTLVVADWAGSSWSPDKAETIIKRLMEAYNDGFSIFLWQEGTPIKLQPDNIAPFIYHHFDKKMTPVSEEDVIGAMANIGLSSDETLVLDNRRLQCWAVNQDTPSAYCLNISELINSKHDISAILALIKNLRPAPGAILNNRMTPLAMFYATYLSQWFNISIEHRPEVLDLDINEINHLLSKGYFIKLGVVIETRQLITLKELIIDSNKIMSDTIQQLLKLIPTLESLDISMGYELEANFKLPTKIKHLKLPPQLSLDTIHPQINSPLESLNSYYLPSALTVQAINSERLIEFSLITNRLTVKPQRDFTILQPLLNNAARLRTLALKADLFNDLPDLTTIGPLHSLQSLHLPIHKKFPATILAQILQKASYLEYLDFPIIDSSITDTVFANCWLPLLQTVNMKIPAQLSTLTFFSQCAPNIKKLSLNSQNKAIEFKSNQLKELQFPTLQTLEIDGEALSSPIIEYLLTTIESLRTLNFYNINLDWMGIRTSKPYPQIMALEVTGIDDTELLFNSFLQRFPNLHTLLIGMIDAVPNEEIFTNLRLERLQSLSVCSQTMTPKDFECILSGQFPLETLRFDQVTFSSALEVSQSRLINLKSLTINHTKLPEKTFISLLCNAPDLIELTLSNEEDYPSKEAKALIAAIRQRTKALGIYQYQKSATEDAPISHTHTLNDLKLLDADTAHNKDKVLHAREILTPLLTPIQSTVRDYRTHAYDHIDINPHACDLMHAFALSNQTNAELAECDINVTDEDFFTLTKRLPVVNNIYYVKGEQEFFLDETWQSIASLSSQDVITHMTLTPPDSAEIRYSKRDNLYYIKATGAPKNTTLTFLVKTPTQSPTPTLPLDITAQVERFNYFDSGELIINKDNATGDDYLMAIETQRLGACRHRSGAFKAWMDKTHPDIPTRIIMNDVHMYIEIFFGNEWVKLDLGGYQAELVVKKFQTPVNAMLHPEQDFTDNPYYAYFETWKKETPTPENAKSYALSKLNQSVPNQLIEVSDNERLQQLSALLQMTAKSIKRPVIYIDSPDALVCSSPYIKKEGNQGTLMPGPGGTLYDQLIAYQEADPIIIIDYSRFSADDIVRTNSLLDKERTIDGMLLPKRASIIGLINPHAPNYYQGSDFYSRFSHIESCPLNLAALEKEAPQLILNKRTPEDNLDPFVINLCHGNDWKEQLMGRWAINKDQLTYVPGLLEEAIASKRPIEIQNGLWNLPAFHTFWQQQRIHGTPITLYQSEGYDWEKLTLIIAFHSGFKAGAIPLNPGELSTFFARFTCDNAHHTLITQPGLLKSLSGQTLSINLTRELTEDQWAKLLIEAKRFNVTLDCYLTPATSLPTALEKPLTADEKTNLFPRPWVNAVRSDDIDVSVSTLANDMDNPLIIEVSECTPAVLLNKMTGHINQVDPKQPFFEFSETQSALYQALDVKQNAKRNIILKGHFSDELMDALAPLLLADKPAGFEGKLALVGDASQQFDYLETTHDSINAKQKMVYLIQQGFGIDEINHLPELGASETVTQSLSRLKRTRLASYLGTNASNPWQGLYGIQQGITLAPLGLTADIKARAEHFIKARVNAVTALLSVNPFIFLTGLSGVGKSTFVETYLRNDHTVLYQGEDRRMDWINDKSDKVKLLFIDEANIGNKQWSEFEGLFNTPPGILVDGTYHPLSANHKVIFAGNPINYGGNRQMASLFLRHGNALQFDPMPLEFIVDVLLKPIIQGSPLEDQLILLSAPLLDVYQFLCQHSNDKLLISPREIQMMALLVFASYQQDSTRSPIELSTHFSYEIGKTLVPKALKHQFDAQFTPEKAFKGSQYTTLGDFHVTPSRQPIINKLEDLLSLRSLRQTTQTLNDSQRFGGLGGLSLEGPPGIGKSELIINVLLNQGFTRYPVPNTVDPNKQFIYLPANMAVSEKKKQLLYAFDEGLVVVADEINSAFMMERLLNDLLMGKSPQGERAKKPGFMLLATQNPATMAGRKITSTALLRRLINTKLDEYPKEEVITLLKERKHQEMDAQLMASAVHFKQHQAKQFNLSPGPTFRHLIRLSDKILAHASSVVSNNNQDIIKISSAKQGLFYQDDSSKENNSPPLYNR